jgi:hypothetical protein
MNLRVNPDRPTTRREMRPWIVTVKSYLTINYLKKRMSSKKTKVQFVSEPDKPDKKKQKPANETTAEEKDFLKQIAHLESTDESSEKSGSSSDTP